MALVPPLLCPMSPRQEKAHHVVEVQMGTERPAAAQPQGQRLLSLRDGCARCSLLSYPTIFLRAFVVLKLLRQKLQSGNRMQLMCPGSVLLTLLLSVCSQGTGLGADGRGGFLQQFGIFIKVPESQRPFGGNGVVCKEV